MTDDAPPPQSPPHCQPYPRTTACLRAACHTHSNSGSSAFSLVFESWNIFQVGGVRELSRASMLQMEWRLPRTTYTLQPFQHTHLIPPTPPADGFTAPKTLSSPYYTSTITAEHNVLPCWPRKQQAFQGACSSRSLTFVIAAWLPAGQGPTNANDKTLCITFDVSVLPAPRAACFICYYFLGAGLIFKLLSSHPFYSSSVQSPHSATLY